MRKVRIDSDVYHKMKTKFKKWMKNELGFIWTGHFNHEDPRNSLIQWKSSNTVCESETIWDEETDEKTHNIFIIDGIQEDMVATHLIDNLEGVDVTSDEDKKVNKESKTKIYCKEMISFIENYKPDFQKMIDEGAPDSLITFQQKDWVKKVEDKMEELQAHVFGIVKTEDDISNDLIDNLLS